MKKALSLILSLIMALSVFTAVPFSVNAVEADIASTGASGTTGDCTWTLDNGVLTISGNGKIEDYIYYNSAPWKNYNFTKAVVEDGVTNIGDYAFYECTSLTSIEIGNSVTTIGYQAFHGCKGLTSVEIPDSVTSIGGSAFIYTAWYDNQPDGLVYAGKVAYKMKGDCPSKVVIKEGTLGIGDYAFCECTDITSVDIPDSVTTIGSSAFSGCAGLKSIVIPDSVTTIGERAFYKCTSLTSIVIPDSVVSIGDKAIGFYSYYRISGFIIYGRHKGTAAEDYAFEHGFEFMLLIGECQNCRAKIIEKDVDVMFDATCTEDGIAYWLCSNCGELGETVLPALGHDYKAVVTRPTCTEGGYTTHTCSRCKDSYVTDEVSALGHDYIIEVVPPSCTEDGYTSHTCTRCGDVYTDNKVKALGHHNFTVEVKKHPTLTQQGVMAVSCENCGLKKNVILPVLSEADYTITKSDEEGKVLFTLRNKANGEYSIVADPPADWHSCTTGDVNDDGVANNRDAMVLDRYVAGWDGYADRIKKIDAADLNGDEKVNNRDAMILDRYVAGWEGYDKYIKMI